MTLCGIYNTETIVVHPDDAPHTSHYIEMEMDKDDPIFYVSCCCDEDWIWAFWYSKSDYEKIKHAILDIVFECESMDEVMDALDEVFVECFDDILVDDEEDEFECDGDCANCEFNED